MTSWPSISKDLRTAKVSPEYAINAWNDVRMNPNEANCIFPTFYQDPMGREINPDTWNYLNHDLQCPMDPMARIEVENTVERPQYFLFLNVDGLNSGGLRETNRNFG